MRANSSWSIVSGWAVFFDSFNGIEFEHRRFVLLEVVRRKKMHSTAIDLGKEKVPLFSQMR
jgi:hypothetical protein